jgi:hypothetical protein
MCWRENPETYATHIFKFQSLKIWGVWRFSR